MYNFKEVESKWQKKWDDNKTFKTNNTSVLFNLVSHKRLNKHKKIEIYTRPCKKHRGTFMQKREEILLKPKIDVVFHALFGRGNNTLLEAMLGDILGTKVKII